MVDTELLERFYSKIFTTPKKRITVTLGFITIALASILNGTVSKSFFAKRYFFVGLVVVMVLLLISRFIHLAFNSRRTFFLALLILIFIEVFDFFAIHLGHFELIVLSPASLSTLLTLVLYFTSKEDMKRIVPAVFFLLFLIYPVDYIFSFNAPHRMLSYAISSVFGVILAVAYVRYLDRNFEGINIKEMLKSFILFWLTSNPDEFEEKLRKVGVKHRGFVKCLEINREFRFINTAFHPGPMRNVGGAKLVGEVLKEKGNVYLHSATKHELNPSSERDVKEIVKSIYCNCKKCLAEKPFKIEGKVYTLYCFPFDCVKLLILSGKSVTDDLPPFLNEYAEKLMGEVILCECHNAYGEFVKVDKAVEDVTKLIEKASRIKSERVEMECCFSEIKLETDDVCGYVKAVLLNYGKKYCILMVDGNNMLLSFRKELERVAEEKGVELIVLTTDNHSKTGISPKVGYKPVGSDRRDRKIIEFLKDFLSKNTHGVTDIRYGRRDVEVVVMGKKFFEGIEKGFRELGEKALYLFWTMIFAEMLLTAILGILLAK